MNSKEAIEKLNEKLLRYDEHYDYADIEIIKQDLDKLEKFAHENASLHTKCESLHTENAELKDKYNQTEYLYQKLRKDNKSLKISFNDLFEQNWILIQKLEKLEKAIEVWKKNIRIRIEPFEVYTYAKFSFEEYDIVSEVLGDD